MFFLHTLYLMINLGYLEYCTLKHLVFLLVILKSVTLEAAEPRGMGKLNKENGLLLNCYRAMLKQIATWLHGSHKDGEMI